MKKSLLIITVLLLFTSCLTTKISDLETNPGAYGGKIVKVSGVVTKAIKIPFTTYYVYELTDKTGDIVIFSSNERVKGRSVKIDAKVVAYSSSDDKKSTEIVVTSIKDFLIERKLVEKEKADKVSKSISSVIISALDKLELTYFLIESANE